MKRKQFKLSFSTKIAFLLAFILALFILDPNLAYKVSQFVFEFLRRANECKYGCS